MKLNQAIRKIHIYTGLQVSILLFIFSLSVFSVLENSDTKATVSTATYSGKMDGDNLEIATSLFKQLGQRFESAPEWWMLQEESKDILTVNLKSPRSHRIVRLNKQNGHIEISTKTRSFLQFSNLMHQESVGRRRFTDSPWLWAWSLYLEISIFALFVLPVTGLYIWLKGRNRTKSWASLSLAASSTAMIALWLSLR